MFLAVFLLSYFSFFGNIWASGLGGDGLRFRNVLAGGVGGAEGGAGREGERFLSCSELRVSFG